MKLRHTILRRDSKQVQECCINGVGSKQGLAQGIRSHIVDKTLIEAYASAAPCTLFLRTARTAHRTVRTSASTCRFPFITVFHHTDDNRRDNNHYNGADDNRSNVF